MGDLNVSRIGQAELVMFRARDPMRLFALGQMLREERERSLGNFMPTVINGKQKSTVRDFFDLGEAGIFLLLLFIGRESRHGILCPFC
jgi:hypothetical protein